MKHQHWLQRTPPTFPNDVVSFIVWFVVFALIGWQTWRRLGLCLGPGKRACWRSTVGCLGCFTVGFCWSFLHQPICCCCRCCHNIYTDNSRSLHPSRTLAPDTLHGRLKPKWDKMDLAWRLSDIVLTDHHIACLDCSAWLGSWIQVCIVISNWRLHIFSIVLVLLNVSRHENTPTIPSVPCIKCVHHNIHKHNVEIRSTMDRTMEVSILGWIKLVCHTRGLFLQPVFGVPSWTF